MESWGIWFPENEGWLKRASDGTVILYPTKAGAAAHLHDHMFTILPSERRDMEVRRVGDDGLPVVYRPDREVEISKEIRI